MPPRAQLATARPPAYVAVGTDGALLLRYQMEKRATEQLMPSGKVQTSEHL